MNDPNEELLRALGRYTRERRASEPDPNLVLLGARERHEITARLTALLQPATPQQVPAAASPAKQGRVLRMLPKIGLWATPLCAAAAFAIWLSSPEPIARLDHYSLEVTSTAADSRAAEATNGRASLRLRPDTVSILHASPSARVNGPVGARAYLQRKTQLSPLALQATVSASGSIKLRLSAPPQQVGPGDMLIVLVGWEPLLAARADELARTPAAQGPGYQRWSLPVEP